MGEDRDQPHVLRQLRRLIYWLLPLLLLTLIFRRVDLAALRERLAGVHLPLLAASLLLAPVGTLVGAWRWRYLIARYLGTPPAFAEVARQYFISATVGFLIPASVGRDAYRVGVMGRRDGRYARHLAAILAEKATALPVQAALAFALLPCARPLMTPETAPVGRTLLHSVLLAMLGGALVPFVFLLLQRMRLAIRIWTFMESRARRLLHRFRNASGEPAGSFTLDDLSRPLLAPAPVLSLTALTLVIQGLNAAAAVLALAAVGCPTPFFVNLFLMPVIFFAFSLPVSVGGVGVREGVFIVLYGLFGVPREAALLASFINFVSTMVIHVIGALLLVRAPSPERNP